MEGAEEGKRGLVDKETGISTFNFQRKKSSWQRGLAREKRRNEETIAEAKLKGSVSRSGQSHQMLQIG